MNNNDFENCAATSSGGAIYWNGVWSATQHRLAYNTFFGCGAFSAGGSLYLVYGSVLADSNKCTSGSANFGGVGYLESATIAAQNNYITANNANVYGAAWCADSSSVLSERNDTVYANVGPDAAHFSVGTGSMTIVNCIYWNPSTTTSEMQCANVSYTCSQDNATELDVSLNTVGAGMVYDLPAFDTGAGEPRLLPTSPCIEKGTLANYAALDFFGTARPQDFDGDRVAVPDIGCYEAPGVPLPVLSPIFRFYNMKNGTHFYTDSAAERDHVIATWPTIYSYEGPAYWTNPANNTQPLTRLYNRVSGSHFYTASPAEAATALAKWPTVFSLDGPTYAVNPGPVQWSTPVYRFYNLRNGSHFYTASEDEKNTVIAKWPTIYSYEGPAFWIGQ